MREIVFRGKRVDNGEWVYGNLITDDDDVYILPQKNLSKGIDIGGWIDGVQSYEVNPETVGQYTGLKDLHGTRIFEADIVKDITPLYKGLTPGVREELLKERAKKRGIAVVKFGYHDVKADDPFCVGRAYGVYFEGDMKLTTPAQYYGYGDWQESEDYQFEVIGNIWDNPELLGR